MQVSCNQWWVFQPRHNSKVTSGKYKGTAPGSLNLSIILLDLCVGTSHWYLATSRTNLGPTFTFTFTWTMYTNLTWTSSTDAGRGSILPHPHNLQPQPRTWVDRNMAEKVKLSTSWVSHTLRYDSKQKPVLMILSRLFNNPALSDVKIKQIYNGKTREYFAHKAILCKESEYFMNAFTGNFKVRVHPGVIDRLT